MSEESQSNESLIGVGSRPIQAASDLTAAIYARTSSAQQRHGYSIDEQVNQCWQRAEHLGWTVSHVFRDEEVSGKDTDREMFQKMLSRAEEGWFDVVLVWKLDRFSRSLIHAVELERELREWGVGLHSVTEMIDTTTPTGRFNFRNISSASELERELIKERTQMGLQALAKQGKWPNDDPPLGYERAQDGKLEIVPEEACLVRFIFGRYIEVKSMPKVAEELHARESDIRDSEWTPYAVGKVLKNKLYTGEYAVAGVEKFIEEYQIIKTEDFEQTTEVRTRFQRQESAERPEMAKKRKNQLVQNVVDQYMSYLTESVLPEPTDFK